jgi:hypothetical protein
MMFTRSAPEVVLVSLGIECLAMISPSGQGYGLPFLTSYYRHNSGTDVLIQHASRAASCMVIL